jgi:hypothetical protein
MHRMIRRLLLFVAILAPGISAAPTRADAPPAHNLALGISLYRADPSATVSASKAPKLTSDRYKAGRGWYLPQLHTYLNDQNNYVDGVYSDVTKRIKSKPWLRIMYVRARIRPESAKPDAPLTDCRYTVYVQTRPRKEPTRLRFTTYMQLQDFKDTCVTPPDWYYNIATGRPERASDSSAHSSADSDPCTREADRLHTSVAQDAPYPLTAVRAREAARRWKASARRQLRSQYQLDAYGPTEMRNFYREDGSNCVMQVAIHVYPTDEIGGHLPNQVATCLYDVWLRELSPHSNRVYAYERHRGEGTYGGRCGAIGAQVKMSGQNYGVRYYQIPDDFHG